MAGIGSFLVSLMVNWYNYPPLYRTLSAGIINFLIDNCADIEADTGGFRSMTPLQWACRSGSLEQIKILITRGANTSVVEKNGNTLVHLCAEYNANEEVDTMDYLVSEGLDLNLAKGEGETPFYLACYSFNFDAVQYPAHKGVDINEIDIKSGLTPREITLRKFDHAMVDFMQEVNSIISFIDTWNRKDEFVEEVGDFADELWLFNMLFQSYCSGEVMAEPSDQE